jgi:hypothetical protein
VSDARPRLSRHGPAGRHEFRRLLLDSRIAATASELELRRSQHQRFRARSVERRLDELRRQRLELDAERISRRARTWYRGATAGVIVTGAWLVGAALLGLQIARHGVHTRLTVAGDVSMLALSLLWFLLAVARVPLRTPEDGG